MCSYLKKLFPCLAAVVLSLTLSVPALAAADFSDVPTDSPWYEGVEYIAEQGISVGTGGNCYSPNAPLTCRQWAVMLCRAFGKTDALSEWGDGADTACLTEAHRSGWLSEEAMTSPDLQMCRGALYHSAFTAIGLPIYDYSLYPGGKSLPVYENCLRIGKELGLCPEDAEALEIVTRGETAKLLLDILTKDLEIEAPPMLAKFQIQNDEDVNMNGFLLELQRVPEPILQAFQRKGWIYTVNYQYLSDLSRRYGMSCVGAADYAAKRIYVSQANATLHEFGHFLDSTLGFPSERLHFYEEEAQASSAFLREYARTNCKEYYADYFVYWLIYHDDTERAAQMRQLTPKTYEHFSQLAANSWGM